MAHIADLHNSGRCGQKRSIEQARHGFAELIAKENREAQNARIRRQVMQLGGRCPACQTPVATPKCHLCHFYPISLPTAPVGDDGLPVLFPKVAGDGTPSAPSRASSVAKTTRTERSERRRATEAKIEALEAMIKEEHAQQQEIVKQIAVVRELVLRDVAAHKHADRVRAMRAGEPA